MSVPIRELVEKFPDLLTLSKGDPNFVVDRLQDAASGTEKDLVFVFTPKNVREVGASKARAWVVHKSLIDKIPPQVEVVLSSANPQLAMARIAKSFFPLTAQRQPIAGASRHPSAQIAASAKIGANTIIGPGVVIGENCVIGEDCILGANTVIEPNVKIGARTYVHPLVFIGHSCELGQDCEVHPHTTIGSEGFGYAYDAAFNAERLTHYGRVVIGNKVHIGAGVQIDRGTYLDSKIGAHTKIDNHSHFGHNTEIGNNSILAGGIVVAGSTKIGSYVVIGGRTTIAGHIEIADKVQIGGASGISKSILKAGEYSGFPLQPLRDTLKTRVLIRNLPKFAKQIKQIMDHLGLKSEDNAEAAEGKEEA